ncbi:MAG: Lrp/AsnC family transcriptional regulator [Bacteroidia bacterium]
MAKLDAIDLKILLHLQQNARITNLELSKEIGLSPAPTLERVRKLEKLQIIEGYHARLNAGKLNLGVSFMVQVSLKNQNEDDLSHFRKHIKSINEIVDCYQVTGNADFILKIVARDIPAFEKLILKEISSLSEVKNIQSTLILSEVKKSNILPLAYSEKNSNVNEY